MAGEYARMTAVDVRDLDDGSLAAVGTGNGRQLNLEQMRVIREIQAPGRKRLTAAQFAGSNAHSGGSQCGTQLLGE